MADQNDQNPRPHADLTSHPRTRPLEIALLAASLLFLGPTLHYLIQRLLIKTTFQLVTLHENVEEHRLFPVSLMAGFLCLMLFRRGSEIYRFSRIAFLGCLASTGLLAPIYLWGAGVLVISRWLVFTKAPAPGRISAWSGLELFSLFLAIILLLLILAPFADSTYDILLPSLLVSSIFTLSYKRIHWLPIFTTFILALLFFIFPFDLKRSYRSMPALASGDQRTITIALETYYLDHNAYPPHTFVPAEKAYWLSTAPMPTFQLNPSTGAPPLTTPVAYLTTLIQDPFRLLNEDRTFAYYSDGPTYIIVSPGPDCVFDITSATLDLFGRQFTHLAPGNPNDTLVPFTYDPSNGSSSAGDVYRYKQ